MIYLRYRGSHFKTAWQTSTMVEEFRPMAARGWKCHLVLEWLPEETVWLNGFHELGVQIHCLPRPRRKLDLRVICMARRLFRRLRPDVVVCENIHTSPMLAAALARVPVRIWIKHAMSAGFEALRNPTFKDRLSLTTRLSAGLATRVLAVSRAVLEELRSLGIAESKLLLRLNPRQTGHRPASGNPLSAREKFGFAPDNVVFVSTGHAVPVKGWDLLLSAFRQVAVADTRARLLLVGGVERSGEQTFAAQLKASAAQPGVAGRVHFTGHTEEVSACLAASDVFVMPSRSEGFSYALIEAMEAGLPCIATRVGVAPDVICSGENGLLVERGSVEQLAEAMLQLCRDVDLRRRMADASCVPSIIPTLPEYATQLADDFEALRFPRGRQRDSTTRTEKSHA